MQDGATVYTSMWLCSRGISLIKNTAFMNIRVCIYAQFYKKVFSSLTLNFFLWDIFVVPLGAEYWIIIISDHLSHITFS